jgi:RNA polymerase sigma-70 factor (ECF subfamily)
VSDSSELDWESALTRAYRRAHGVLRDAQLAEEIAQQACLKALAHLNTFAGRGSFAAWVGSIAFHLAIDARKRVLADPIDAELLPDRDDPERNAGEREATDALLRCLEGLTEHQRRIFLAKHLDGLKGAEIAAEMRLREGTVWATLNQSAANLRRCLDRHGIHGEVLH